MKFSELAKYCESICIDCDVCEHQKECKHMLEHLEDMSPKGVKEMVEEDIEL
jgi:hypothetical protein